ncbi:AcrA Membrane-fusion protein [Burkholderiaceae bacterium]
MKRLQLWGLVGVIALVGLGYGSWQRWAGPRIAVEVLQRQDVVQTMVASGHVQSPHRTDVSAQVTGRVVAIPVTEGQWVRQGQTLIELDSSEAQANHQQALANSQQAQVNVRQLLELRLPVAEQTWLQAQANLKVAQQSLARSQTLFEQGFVGASARDDAQRGLDVAQAQLQIAAQQRQSLLPGGSDEAAAHSAVQVARASAASAAARLRYMRIVAPVDGVLIARSVEPGDGVQPGKVLMVLSPKADMQLVLQIDEKNLHLLRLNQAAWASADAYPDQKFDAELVYINPRVDPLRGSVEVKLHVPKPPAYLQQDMTVSVDIEVARRPQSLWLPLTAVQTAGSDGPAVWVMRDQQLHRQRVTLGLRHQGRVEVLAGLDAGERLATQPMPHWQEGQRVRAVPP